MHEFIHALGFHHEQVRPDRDDYVEIIWENIPEQWAPNFWLFEGSNTYGVAYDGLSVMHYDAWAFSSFTTSDGYTIVSKVHDLEFVLNLGLGPSLCTVFYLRDRP